MPYSNIIWIKLEVRLLNDYRFYTLSEGTQLIFIKFLILAGQNYNKIPKDIKILKSIFRSLMTEDELKMSINSIKKNFSKFKENPHYYYFSEFSNRHNWVVPTELQRKSQGVPKEPIEKSRVEKSRKEEKGTPPKKKFTPDDDYADLKKEALKRIPKGVIPTEYIIKKKIKEILSDQ